MIYWFERPRDRMGQIVWHQRLKRFEFKERVKHFEPIFKEAVLKRVTRVIFVLDPQYSVKQITRFGPVTRFVSLDAENFHLKVYYDNILVFAEEADELFDSFQIVFAPEDFNTDNYMTRVLSYVERLQ